MSSVKVRQRDGLVQGGLVERQTVGFMRGLAGLFRPFGYRGYSRACQAIANAVLPGVDAQISLDSDTEFSFPLNDTYWVRLITSSFTYEPEVASLLMLIRSRAFSFVDCGANFGYWSCVVSSQRFGSHRAIAIEPSATTFARLQKNADLNGGRFGAEQLAISSESGMTVRLGGGSHAARSILSPDGECVTTATIDELVEKHRLAGPLVIKLDVEGVEIPALEGARQALATNPLLLYEDHGNDPTSKVSAYLLERGWKLFSIWSGAPRLMSGLSDVNALKSDRRTGYNFVAVRDGVWF